VSFDSAACGQDQGRDEANEPAEDARRYAELEDRKPGSRWVGRKTNKQPNDSPD
jgi:hypothetical protein